MTSFYQPSDKIINLLRGCQAAVTTKFRDDIIGTDFSFSELTITVSLSSLVDVIGFLKDNSKFLFRQLSDITAVDYPERSKRFEVVYVFLSLSYNLRIKVKTLVADGELVESITGLYANADWLEREVFDMFGIYFSNHPDLRRILTDFGFEGHPLRKDFPLSGFTEVYFDENKQMVRYKSVDLPNEYRDFKSDNYWLDMQRKKFNQE